MRTIGSLCCALVWLALGACAQAADGAGDAGQATNAPGWIATLGFSAEVATGGDQSLLPSTIELHRADEPEGFGAPDDAFGWALLDWNGLSLGPAGDVRRVANKLAVDGGGFAEAWPIEGRLRVRAEALDNIGSGQGAHLTLGSDLVLPAPAGATFSVGPRLTLGTEDYFKTGMEARDAVPASRRFYAGATTALKIPVTSAVSTTLYDEVQTPLAGNGRRDGRAENTLGAELDFSFKVP